MTTEEQQMLLDLTGGLIETNMEGLSEYEKSVVLLKPFYEKYKELGFLNNKSDPVIKNILGELYPEDFI